MNSILVEIKSAGDTYGLAVDAGQLGSAEASPAYEFEQSGRIAEVLQRIDTGHCDLDNLRDVGSELYDSIFSGRTLDVFKALGGRANGDEIAMVRLNVPRELQQLPWEALYNEDYGGFLETHPNYCIVREARSDGVPGVNLPVTQTPLTMLVVIPDGSGLNVEQEWHNLQQVCEKYVKVERVDGRVTPDLLASRLAEKQYNIVHFIGHGEVTGNDQFTIRLNNPNDQREFWMDAQTFARLFFRNPPQLVVLNCCLGAAASPKRTMTGIAPALLQAGASAVVAMRYEIPDQVASEFTAGFYRELLMGRKPGRVDSAVSAARNQIYRNKSDSTIRGFITPVLYLKHLREQLFEIPQVRAARADSIPQARVEEQIPEDLRLCIEMLRRRDCVAVVGPGVLSSSPLTRSARQPPSVRELAERLAAESNYPLAEETGGDKNTEEWHTGLLLPWVCQHYQRVRRRYELIRSIEKAYNDAETPLVFKALAGLGMPGIVYMHFDGLIEKAFQERNTPVQTIAAVDQRFESDIKGTVLLCLKGLLRFQGSLILTEEDNETLYDRIAQLSPVLRDRMRGEVGRSALFVGVSPRCQLVRRMAAQFLEAGQTRTQGPTFFICNYHSTGDEAYWSKYDVRWIAHDLDQFLSLLPRDLK